MKSLRARAGTILRIGSFVAIAATTGALAVGDPGTAAAADGDGGLLGGVTRPLADALAPVVEQVAAPVVQQAVAPVVQQVVAPVAPVVQDVVAPVVSIAAPVVEPLVPVVAPVLPVVVPTVPVTAPSTTPEPAPVVPVVTARPDPVPVAPAAPAPVAAPGATVAGPESGPAAPAAGSPVLAPAIDSVVAPGTATTATARRFPFLPGDPTTGRTGYPYIFTTSHPVDLTHTTDIATAPEPTGQKAAPLADSMVGGDGGGRSVPLTIGVVAAGALALFLVGRRLAAYLPWRSQDELSDFDFPD